MKKSFCKKSCLLLLLLMLSFSISGCWQSKELESLEILTAAAIDLAKPQDVQEQNNTAQEEATKNAAPGGESGQGSPSGAGSQGGSQGDSQKPAAKETESKKQAQESKVYPEVETEKYMLTTETASLEAGSDGGIQAKNTAAYGNSFFLAGRHIAQFTEKTLYWNHLSIMILGENFAKDGVYPLIDLICRTNKIRLNVLLLVAKGADGADVLKCPNSEKQIPSRHLSGMVYNTYKYNLDPAIKAYRFINELGDNQGIATLPAVSLQPNPDTGLPMTVLDGVAVFKDAKLLGFLPDQESQYFHMAINSYQTGYPLSLEKDGQALIDLDLKSGKTKFLYAINADGSLRFQLNMKLDFVIGESNLQDNVFFLRPHQGIPGHGRRKNKTPNGSLHPLCTAKFRRGYFQFRHNHQSPQYPKMARAGRSLERLVRGSPSGSETRSEHPLYRLVKGAGQNRRGTNRGRKRRRKTNKNKNS